MEVVVFGAGSLGSLVGGLLARTHDVTLVGRDPHMAAVRDHGLRITGVEEVVVQPEATTDGGNLTAELAIVTVKAFDTGTAARELATGDVDAVLSLQNGMGNEDILAEHLDCPVMAGATTHGALLREPGHVEWTGRGEVVVGGWQPPESPRVEPIVAAFDDAGLRAVLEPDMRYALWLKLAVNAAINPVTALVGCRNGALRDGPAAAIAGDAAREVAAVARAGGVELSDASAVERVQTVVDSTAENRSSMHVDMAAGTRTEIDHINGYVVDHASGLDVPVNRVLAALVRAWEVDEGLR